MKITLQRNDNYCFTVVKNEFIFDFNLSFKAKGIFLVLLALPDMWNFSVKGLAVYMGVSVNTINSGLHELEENGYLVRKIIRESGKIIRCDYTLTYPERESLNNNFEESEEINEEVTKEVIEEVVEEVVEEYSKEVIEASTVSDIPTYSNEKIIIRDYYCDNYVFYSGIISEKANRSFDFVFGTLIHSLKLSRSNNIKIKNKIYTRSDILRSLKYLTSDRIDSIIYSLDIYNVKYKFAYVLKCVLDHDDRINYNRINDKWFNMKDLLLAI